MIEKQQEQLIRKFIEIANKKWIKGINNSTNSVGLTFESLIDKSADSMYFPDYCGIEIKCTQRFSRYPIKLFSISFDGPNLYEMNRILKTYGKPDLVYKNKYQLQGTLYINKYSKINNNNFKIKIDKEHKKINLCIYGLDNNLIEDKIYIDYQTIKSRLELKLSNLAVVYASKKNINNDKYFRYYQIIIYKLKSFDTFIKLLEQENIKISIIGRVSRSGNEQGRQRNQNIVFSLSKEQIELLFDKVIDYNYDNNSYFDFI